MNRNRPFVIAPAILLGLAAAGLILGACGSGKVARVDEKTLLNEIEAIATRVDRTPEANWVGDQYARVFKSGYARVSPHVKALFAMDYEKMLERRGQNLAVDIKTYVPYKDRSAFALAWWQNSPYKDAFAGETRKKKVQWVHESLLDAGELWWRAWELYQNGQVNSGGVMAHYKEQEMVYDYMEDESTHGTFSDQYAKWSEPDEKSGNDNEKVGTDISANEDVENKNLADRTKRSNDAAKNAKNEDAKSNGLKTGGM